MVAAADSGEAVEQDTAEVEPVEPVEAVEEPESAPETAPDDADEPEGRSGNKEAAKYRARARDAEQARDALATRLDTLRRQVIDAHITATHAVNPAGVWAAGVTMDDFLDDGGDVSLEKADQHTTAAIERLGLNVRPRPKVDPNAGRSGHGSGPRATWADAINPARRG